jgi:uncharacterized protein
MIQRKFYLNKIHQAFEVLPIVILIGARQVGKTSLMNMFTHTKNEIFLNGQDPEVASLFEKLTTLETYLRIYLSEDLDGFILIDEFQYIPGISTMLKLLTDKHERIKVLCSGSSSLDIMQEVEESLAGRVRWIEVYSLSFAEYLQFNDDQLHRLYHHLGKETEDTGLTAPLHSYFDEYLVYGGLPRGATNRDPKQKLAILDDIYKTYLQKDVRSYIKNEHAVGFNKLLRLLALQTGNLLNMNGLSRESGLSYRHCEEYVYLLQQMYIIKLIEPYSTNKRSALTKMKKIYFSDIGIRNIINTDFGNIHFRPDNGALFENFVLLELLRHMNPGGDIRFYRTTDGAEVDFVVNNVYEKLAIECKFSTFHKPSHSRSLNAFSGMEGIEKRFIINKSLNASDRGVQFLQGYMAGKIIEQT